MQEIKAYKLSNGEIVESLTMATNIQKDLDFQKGLEDLAEYSDACFGLERKYLLDFFLREGERIYKLLKDKYED